MTLGEAIARVKRQSGAYALASLVGPGTGVLLLPVYTRFLTPAEYGLIALLEVIALVLGAIFSLGMPAAIQFYYTESLDVQRRRRLMGTILAGITAVNLGLGLLALLGGRPLLGLLLPSVPYSPFVPIVVLTMIVEPYWAVLGVVLQMREQASRYALLSTIRYFVSIGLRVWLVVVLAQGVFGFIMANLLTAVCGAVAAGVLLRKETAFALEVPELRKALALGLPMVPSNLLSYSFRLLDRVVLERVATLEQVGLYYLATRIAEGMRIGADVFVNAWRPVFFKHAADEGFRVEVMPQVVRLATMAFTAGFLLFSLFAREMAALLLAPEYRAAWIYVPVLAAAFAIKGVHAFPYLTVWYRKKTAYIAVLTLATVVFSVAANVVLGRRWGALGVGVALMLSHALLFALMFGVARRLFPLVYPLRAMAGTAMTALVLAAAGTSLEPGLAGTAMKLVLLCVYPVVLVSAHWISWSEVRTIVSR